jgi:outer membrane protein assembly factor BamD (BamD/ComL family)
MVGFVYAEELFDYVTADRKLNEVVQRYPNTEYADMARWMMDNMGDGTPKFEDMSDVNKKMKEDS